MTKLRPCTTPFNVAKFLKSVIQLEQTNTLRSQNCCKSDTCLNSTVQRMQLRQLHRAHAGNVPPTFTNNIDANFWKSKFLTIVHETF